MAIKNYVLDTNVLIQDPKSIFRFEDNNIYIPIYVLEELDKFKSEQSERGHASREAIRAIDDLRTTGSLEEGIPISDEENSGKLFVCALKELKENPAFVQDSMDNRIILCALDVQQSSEIRTILVTMDINLRVRAEAIGLQVASYEYQSVDVTQLNNNIITMNIDADAMQRFYNAGFIYPDAKLAQELNLEYNSCIMLVSGSSTALARYYKREQGTELSLNKLNIPDHLFGLRPRNREQKFALDILLDPKIQFVTLMGTAGSGKTLLTTAAALYQILEDPRYERLLVSRPIMPMGKDIGYLPGTAEEKMMPYMKPIYDNIDYCLMSGQGKKKYGLNVAEKMFQDKTIEIEPLVYIRGRSIQNQIMILDEAQSLNTHEVKTILTRCGEGTKIILTGDINQIDNPYVSSSTNGLSVAVKKMRNSPLVAHLLLEKGERSPLANLAVESL